MGRPEHQERPEHWRQIEAALAEMPESGDLHYGGFEDLHDDATSTKWIVIARPGDEKVILFSATKSPDSEDEPATAEVTITHAKIVLCPMEQGKPWSLLERRAAQAAAEKASGGTFVNVLHRIWTPARQYIIAIVAERGFHNTFQLIEVDRPEGGLFRKHPPAAHQRARRPLPILFKDKNHYVYKRSVQVVKTTFSIEG